MNASPTPIIPNKTLEKWTLEKSAENLRVRSQCNGRILVNSDLLAHVIMAGAPVDPEGWAS